MNMPVTQTIPSISIRIGNEFTMRHRVRLSAKSIPRFDTACPGRYPLPPPPPSFFQNEEPSRIEFDVTELNWQETDQWRFSLRHAKPWYRIQTLRFVSKIFFRLTLSREWGQRFESWQQWMYRLLLWRKGRSPWQRGAPLAFLMVGVLAKSLYSMGIVGNQSVLVPS